MFLNVINLSLRENVNYLERNDKVTYCEALYLKPH